MPTSTWTIICGNLGLSVESRQNLLVGACPVTRLSLAHAVGMAKGYPTNRLNSRLTLIRQADRHYTVYVV
jgi:hypothetical protein